MLQTLNYYDRNKIKKIQVDLEKSKSYLQEKQAALHLPKKEPTDLNHLSVELVSVHIPKVAGTLFRNVLQKIYGDKHCLWDYTAYLSPDSDNLYEDLNKILPHHKVIHGHTAWRWVHRLKSKNIIWVRNPIVRIISQYFYVKSFSKEFWMTTPGGELNQYIIETNMQLEDYIEIESPNYLYAHCNLQGDINNLATVYDFVGIQEFFNSEFVDLSRLFGWSKIELWKENETQHSKYKDGLKKALADKKLISKIVSFNKKDVDLYKLALELRAERKGLSNFQSSNSLDMPV